MKFFESVLLLILGFSPLIKITVSINCQISSSDGDIEECGKKAVQLEQSGADKNKVKSEIFACIQIGITGTPKDETCHPGATGCGTVTFKLKDQTDFVGKMCDNDKHEACNAIKKGLVQAFEDYNVIDFVEDSRCDFCSSDYCNNETPRNKTSVPPQLPSRHPTQLPSRHPTQLPSRHPTRLPPKEKLSASLSAVSTPPSATVIFIIVSIIHILL